MCLRSSPAKAIFELGKKVGGQRRVILEGAKVDPPRSKWRGKLSVGHIQTSGAFDLKIISPPNELRLFSLACVSSYLQGIYSAVPVSF